MKPAREARKGGVWILEIHKIGEEWVPLRVYKTKAAAWRGRLDAFAKYRAVRYIPAPAQPRRSARRKRK